MKTEVYWVIRAWVRQGKTENQPGKWQCILEERHDTEEAYKRHLAHAAPVVDSWGKRGRLVTERHEIHPLIECDPPKNKRFVYDPEDKEKRSEREKRVDD